MLGERVSNLFNPNNLVFLEDRYLSMARSINPRILLAVLGVLLLSRFLRSWSLWVLARRYSIKGSFLLSQLPFVSIFLNYRLGRELCGMGAKTRVLFKVLLLSYLVGLVLVLVAPNFNLMVMGGVLAVVPYLLSIQYWSTVSEGVLGRESLWWYVPIVGSLMIIHSVGNSYERDIYQKPKNFDTFFKKAEDLEISL